MSDCSETIRQDVIAALKAAHDLAWRAQDHQKVIRCINDLRKLGAIKIEPAVEIVGRKRSAIHGHTTW
jgi:hypothetical protein